MKREWMSKRTTPAKILAAGFCLSSQISKKSNPKLFDAIEEVKKHHKPYPEYRSNGFRFSTDYIHSIHGHVIKLPIDFMADFVSKRNKHKVDIKNTDILYLLDRLVKSPDLYQQFPFIQAHEIGLAAYIVITSKDKQALNSALLFLDLYRQYNLSCSVTHNKELKKQVKSHAEWLKTLNKN